MARSISQALTRTTSSLSPLPPRLLPGHNRNRSYRTEPPVIRFSFNGERGSDAEKAAIQKMEDSIHQIAIKMSQPDWLPFLPGTSYLVPPKRKSSRRLAQTTGKLQNSFSVKNHVIEIASNHGWPSSANFFKECDQAQAEYIGSYNNHNSTQSEDEES